MATISPHAVVSPDAHIGPSVTIGPFSIIESGVVIGEGCQIASHVVLKVGTILGERNQIAEGAVLGGLPQNVDLPDQVGGLQIGDDNIIREFSTLHRSLFENQSTKVGHRNMLMVGTHGAHDSVIYNDVILTNGVQLAGHAEIQDHAFVSAGVGIHQFARIGCYAMVGGHARVVQDVLPYVTMDGGTSTIVGLNLIGLRRNNFSTDQIKELKAAYRTIYREGLNWREIPKTLRDRFPEGPAAEIHRFMDSGTRGFAPERRTPPGATVRIHKDDVEQPSRSRRVG